MIVEVLGPPGAGKSWLLPALVTQLAGADGDALGGDAAVDRVLRQNRGPVGRVLAERRPHLGRVLLVDAPAAILFLASHPRLATVAFTAVLQCPVPWRHRRLLLARFATAAARNRVFARELGRCVVVVDEGMLHRAVNLFAWHALDRRDSPSVVSRPAGVDRYLALVPWPDRAVYVTASGAVRRRRLERRGLPARLRGRSPSDADAFIRSAEAILNRIRSNDAARSRIVVVANDGDRGADAIARSVAAQVTRTMLATPREWPSPRLGPWIRRPRRMWERRPRTLTELETVEIGEVLSAVRLGDPRSLTTIGKGRSWTVRAVTDQGDWLVKRYGRGVEDDAVVAEHDTLTALEELDIPAPRLVRDPSGTSVVRRSRDRYAVYRYEPKRVAMHEILVGPRSGLRLSSAAGACLARIHVALSGRRPAARPTNGLDSAGQRVVPSAWHVERFEAHGAAVLGARAVEPAARRLEEVDRVLTAARLRRGIIHGDYGPYNILVGSECPMLVVDYELTREDWWLVDVATALPRFVQRRLGRRRGHHEAFLRAYVDEAGLAADEIELLSTVLEFLSLRRAAVCIERAVTTGGGWPGEARRHYAVARRLASGDHFLAHKARTEVAA